MLNIPPGDLLLEASSSTSRALGGLSARRIQRVMGPERAWQIGIHVEMEWENHNDYIGL